MIGKATILAVDDCPESLALFVSALTAAGYRVCPADSGELALAAVAANPPDLILLDVRMKGIDGLEVCRRLKALDESRNIPIILISGFADVDDRIAGLQSGAVDYIIKPFRYEELLARIGTHLTLRRATLELEMQAAKLNEANGRLQAEIAERARAEEGMEASLGRSERSRLAILSFLEDQKRMEKALRESKKKLDLISKNAKDSLWLMDLSMRTTWITPSSTWARGYSLEELKQMPMARHFTPASMTMILELSAKNLTVERLADAGDEIEIEGEFEFVCKDGSTIWLESILTLLRDEEGKPSGFLGIGRDISKRKSAEHGLEVSERRYRRLFESAKDGILIMDAESGRIVDANPFLMEMTDYSMSDFLGKELWEIGVFKDILASKTSYKELKANNYVRYDDLPLKTRDGRRLDVEFVSNCYSVDDANVIQCNIRDITARKTAEDELKFKNLILSTQQEASIDGILVVDAHGVVISSNRWFGEMWNIPREIMDEKSEERVLRAAEGMLADPEDFLRTVRHICAHPDEKSHDEIALKDGRTFERHSAPMLDGEKNAIGRVWFFRDITTRIAAERSRSELETQLRIAQKMEAIGSLAGGIAHDFNNILSVILSYTSFALGNLREGDPMRDDLLEVKKAGERAATLTRQLLAFSRKQVLQPVTLSLNHVVVGIEKMLRRILGEDIDFILNLASDLGLTMTDPGQIEQVLMNLVVNARDAMPDGGKLTIETRNAEIGDDDCAGARETAKPGSYVMLAVSDSGCGMDERTKEKIFEPFFTTKGLGKGTGLGLSTVYGIVKQSGGATTVYSELGQGSTFKIYLPRDPAAAFVAEPTPSVAKSAAGTETILVVEDEEALREVAKKTLSAEGYTVLTAADGYEALSVSARHAGIIQLLLTDVVMPRMSGRELAQSIAKERRGISIIYMSGYTDDAIVHHGVLDGEMDFLGKPFTATSLTSKVREVLDRPIDDAGERRGRPGPASDIPDVDSIRGETLRAVSSATLGKLGKALVAARYDEIVELIETIRTDDPQAATALRKMADLYDYDGLRVILGA
jgi:two-component system cell cycle sensor histidine kinase/response regulator CckA